MLALRGLQGEEPALAATVALAWDERVLTARFDVACEPPLVVEASPAWANDCVEAFLATDEVPWRYLEVVLDAAGRVYAARVENPDASRATWTLTPQEPPPGLEAQARGEGEPRARLRWTARLGVPWDAVGVVPRAGSALRGNFFRIARGRATHHLALSPTLRADPPEFHVPSRFARLVLA